MINRKHDLRKRLLKISLISILILITAGLSASYFLLHSYINKVNIENSPKDIDIFSSIGKPEDTAVSAVENVQGTDSDEPMPELAPASEGDILTLEEQIQKNLEDNSTPVEFDYEIFNLLLIGSDNRSPEETGRSDAMILISINKKAKSITCTSFLRDIYLKIPNHQYNRLNAAYTFGGAELLMETLKQNFKIELDQYVSVDFNAFIDVVDAIGGVTMEVTSEEMQEMNQRIRGNNQAIGREETADCLTIPGVQLLNGRQTLAYVRNRNVGNNDFDRTLRQRKVLVQIYDQLKSQNLIQLKKLLDIILPQVTTNLPESEILSLILSLPAFTKYTIDPWSVPMDNTYSDMNIRGMAVLGIDFEKNIAQLHQKFSQD